MASKKGLVSFTESSRLLTEVPCPHDEKYPEWAQEIDQVDLAHIRYLQGEETAMKLVKVGLVLVLASLVLLAL